MIKTRLQTQELSGVRPLHPARDSHARTPGQLQTRQVVTVCVNPGDGGGIGGAAGGGSNVRLTGMAGAAKAIYREGGLGGFARGLVPRLLVSAPSVAVSWTAYECAKGLLANVGV
jgi:hypothetical protein